MVVSTVGNLDFTVSDLPSMSVPGSVLMTTPTYFDVVYEINPHMAGNIGSVDQGRARRQWDALREAYVRIGLAVTCVDGVPGLPDMVFCANQSLPFVAADQGPGVVLSRMRAVQRRDEVSYFEDFFRARNYRILRLPESIRRFEGMGDAIWHFGRRLLWGGSGFRTDASAYAALAEALTTTVVSLDLVDADFYHLDTCLSVLDEHTALIYPGAFTPEGLELIRCLFARVLEAPESEARDRFAVNAHCPDGEHVLIQRGCHETEAVLRSAGYNVVSVETDEFLKAGGSVFCMKQMFW
jgi:N-dimethylarginine dimethylaminohydrolase